MARSIYRLAEMRARCVPPAACMAATVAAGAIAAASIVGGALGQAPQPPLPLPDWKGAARKTDPRVADALIPDIPGDKPAPVGGAGSLVPPVDVIGGATRDLMGMDRPESNPADAYFPDDGPDAPAPTMFPAHAPTSELPEFDFPPITPEEDLPPLPDVAEEEGAVWHRNPRVARRIAEEEGKFLVLAFVGFGWNSLSGALNDEVLASAGFSELARDRLVLSYIDYPRNQTHEDLHPVFQSFKQYCGVEGFPAVAVFSPEGEQLDLVTGYRRGRAQEYLDAFRAKIDWFHQKREKERKRRDDLLASGFRTWTNTKGQTIFARLLDLRAGRVFFEEDDGERSAVPVDILSFGDREAARRIAENGGQIPFRPTAGIPMLE